MNLKIKSAKESRSVVTQTVAATLLIISNIFLVSTSSYAAITRDPPPPGRGQGERRVDLDANIIREFNILNDAVEAGLQQRLDVNAKYQLIELMKQASALMGASSGQMPQPQQPLPPIQQPMPQPSYYISAGDHVMIDPNRLNHWWGSDEAIVQVVLSSSQVRVFNPTKNAYGDFSMADLMKSVSYYGGFSIGQRVFVTSPGHWWNQKNAEAYIDMIFSNGMVKLKCPRLNAEGLFSIGQIVKY